MNLIGINRMSIEVSNYFNWINFSLDLHLVRLHCFLDSSSNLPQSCIYACFSDSSVSGILDCLKKLIIGRVEGHSESAIDDPAFNLGSEVNFAYIVIGKHSIVSRIRRVMSSDIVQGASSRKSDARLKAFFRSQLSIIVLELFANVD